MDASNQALEVSRVSTGSDDALREKLRGRHLFGESGISESVKGGITAQSLAGDIASVIEHHGWLRQLAQGSGDPIAMRHGVSRLELPREILLRLAVVRDQRPALYRHTLGVAAICHYLALCLALKPRETDHVLMAALCHDLGELHTDPVILAPEHKVADEERRFIYVHPITGFLIIRDIPGVGPQVARAILQHQERIDGSGYPYGRKGEAIGLGGRILAAADVAESIMARFNDPGRLATLLRLNREKFDGRLVDCLHGTISGKEAAKACFERASLSNRLTELVSVLEGWTRVQASAGGDGETAATFLSERIRSLHKGLIGAGFDPDNLESSLQLAEGDCTLAAELAATVDELQFQLADLAHEFDRTAPHWMDDLDILATIAITDWRQQLQLCIDAAD